MSAQLLFDYLDSQRALYNRQAHSIAYTAMDVAASGHINQANFAKVVMVNIDGELAMAILPALYQLDIESLRSALKAQRVELAQERDFYYRFPRCEPGAMPPFGHLFGFQAFLITAFDDRQEIAFNAGSHSEIVRMPYREFLRFAHVTELECGLRNVSPVSLERSLAAVAVS